MSLLTPLGLIALIGLPIIIIIYILKPKYQEKTINSTYIWRLSLRYKKRKIPLSWLKRSLLLIVQLLIMAILAFMIAQPFIKHPKPQFERIIILDASASMMAVDADGKTRFDKAKEKIVAEAEEASQEFDFSIILCNDDPSWLVQNAFSVSGEGDNSANDTDQKALGVNKINLELGKTKCTNKPCDYTKAIELANEYRKGNPDAKVILYTDKTFSRPGYVTVENFATEGEWNASILSVEELKGGYDALYFEVVVGSYLKSDDLVLNAEITGVNGYEEGPESVLTFSETVQFNGDKTESDPITIRGEKEIVNGKEEDHRIYSYSQAKFYLTTTTGAPVEDNYSYDNEFYCFGLSNDLFSARVEVVNSNKNIHQPYVLTALALGENVNCTEVSDKMREDVESGNSGVKYQTPAASDFDLYVYDTRMPTMIPDDGAVWLVNVPTDWNLSKELGITIGAATPTTSKENMHSIDLAVTQEESVLVKSLGLFKSLKLLKASQYRPITIAENNPYNFKTILTVEGKPVMIAGENAQGVRMVITSLDMEYTDLPTSALPLLAQNVVNYSLSYTLNDLSYAVGDTVDVYSKPKVESATISVEGEEDKPLTFVKQNGEFPISLVVDKPGVYTISQEFSNTSVNKITKFFVHIDAEECKFGVDGGILADEDGSTPAGDALENSDVFDIEDITFYFAAAMLLLLLIEWGLQYREQY